ASAARSRISTRASGKAARINASISLAAIGISIRLLKVGLLYDLPPGLDQLLSQRLADQACLAIDTGGDQIAQHLADHSLVASLLEVGPNDIPGIGLGLDAGQTHLTCSPF